MAQSNLHPQLPLELGPEQQYSFGNFWVGQNKTLVEVSKHFASGNSNDSQLFICGAGRCGKTHLLSAVCHAAIGQGCRIAYMGAQLIDSLESISGYEQYDLVCIDDVHKLPQREESELALFSLINGLRQFDGRLMLSASTVVTDLNIQLRDLSTRLSWGASYTLQEVPEEDFVQALAMRAGYLGVNMSDQVANYLRARCTREFAALVDLLNLLNTAGLQSQRKITVPFVREILTQNGQEF